MEFSDRDRYYMELAMELAREAAELGETPVGAVIVRKDGLIAGKGKNSREGSRNALCHAEIIAIDQACRTLGGWRLHGCTLYVTLEPCPMCAGAIINSRIDRVVFAASDPKAGSAGSVSDLFGMNYNHRPEVLSGVMETESKALLKNFFTELRRKKQKMSGINLTEVTTASQIESVAKMADEIWHEWFPAVISESQIDYMLEKFQSVSAITAQLGNEGYRYYIIMNGGEYVGYTAIRPDSDGRLFLSKIYIKKEHRGKGFGKAVFEFLKGFCRRNGLNAVWLTVNKNNTDSINVYKKCGFKLIGEGITDIGGGHVMDDYFFQLDV